MTCHMGEFTVLVLWSECDQCGTPVEFRASAGVSDFRLRDVRDDWNEHHKVCSVAKGVRAEPFKVPEDEHSGQPLATITDM